MPAVSSAPGTTVTATRATAAGAVDFKSWYMVVWVTAGEMVWPRVCACCRRRSESTEELMDGDVAVARYPICRPCRRHARLDDIAMGIALALGAIVIVGGYLAVFGFSVMSRIGLQLVVMFIAFVLASGAAYGLIGLFVRGRLGRCPDEGWPVETYHPVGFGGVLGKDAERSDEKNLREWCAAAADKLGPGAYALQFRNYDYARAFIQANGGDASRVQTIHEAF